jgi:signal transduction histidine kinase
VRRRVLLVLSVFSILAVAGFGLPLLDNLAVRRTQQWVLTRTTDLDRFARLAEPAGADPALLTQAVRRHRELYGEGVLVVDQTGRVVAGAGLSLSEPGVVDAVDNALRNQAVDLPDRLFPWSAGPVLLGRPVGTGTQAAGAVVVLADVSRAAADIGRDWTVVLLGVVAAAVAFAVLALLLARWVLRPVRALSGGVGAVARGGPGEHLATSAGPSELRDLTVAFNRMVDTVSASAEQQRRLVADASHQIRNPLAALRLRVDALDDHVTASGRATYASAATEVERLEALLDGLLGLASADARATSLAAGAEAAEHCDAAAVVADRLDAWQPVAVAAGGTLTIRTEEALPVACQESDLAQLLDVLVDNAIRHTGRDTAVTVTAAGDSSAVTVTVTDTGPGIPEDDLSRAVERFWHHGPGGGSGLGLSIADRLASAHGGTLRLENVPGGGVCVRVVLPR